MKVTLLRIFCTYQLLSRIHVYYQISADKPCRELSQYSQELPILFFEFERDRVT